MHRELHVWAQRWWWSIALPALVPGKGYKLFPVALICNDLVPDARIYCAMFLRGWFCGNRPGLAIILTVLTFDAPNPPSCIAEFSVHNKAACHKVLDVKFRAELSLPQESTRVKGQDVCRTAFSV